jgi:hypothetical protein
MENTIVTQVTLYQGEKLVVERDKKFTKAPNYYKVGNGTMNKDKIQARDFIDELIGLSKPAQRVIGWIKDGMKYNPYDERVDFVVKIVPDANADKKMLQKALPELFAKDLVRRVKRGYYMIDPHAITTDFKEQLLVWNECECKKKVEEKNDEFLHS